MVQKWRNHTDILNIVTILSKCVIFNTFKNTKCCLQCAHFFIYGPIEQKQNLITSKLRSFSPEKTSILRHFFIFFLALALIVCCGCTMSDYYPTHTAYGADMEPHKWMIWTGPGDGGAVGGLPCLSGWEEPQTFSHINMCLGLCWGPSRWSLVSAPGICRAAIVYVHD